MKDFPHITSNIMGEYIDSFGNIIVGRESAGTPVSYPLGTGTLFKGTEPFGTSYNGTMNYPSEMSFDVKNRVIQISRDIIIKRILGRK